MPKTSSGRGFDRCICLLSSLLGSVQRPHSDGEKWDKAEQPPTDPNPDAATSTLRSECLSSLTNTSVQSWEAAVRPWGQLACWPITGTACAMCVEGGCVGSHFLASCACPLSVWACLPSLERRGRVSFPCREEHSCQCLQLTPPPVWLGRKALSSAFRWAYSNQPFLLPLFFFLRQISCLRHSSPTHPLLPGSRFPLDQFLFRWSCQVLILGHSPFLS